MCGKNVWLGDRLGGKVGYFGGHDAVEFRILREVIHKGQDGGAIKQQPLALAGVGHIGKLVRGDAQLPGQNLPVAARLVEHIHEVRVL